MNREETTTESLKCILTDAEKLDLGEKQAKDFAELQRLDDRLKEVSGQIKAQMKEVEARLKAASETIRNGYQYRDVDVLKVIDGEMVRYYRTDTGESYRERGVFASERQMVLEVTKASATETLERASQAPQDTAQEPVPVASGMLPEWSEDLPASLAEPQCSEVTASDLSPEDMVGEETTPEQPAEAPATGQEEIDQAWSNLCGSTSEPEKPAFDKDAQDFLDQATPGEKAAILDPVKTRAQILAETPIAPEAAAAQGIPVEPGTSSERPEPFSRRPRRRSIQQS